MGKLALGIDLGSNNVGHSLVLLNEEELDIETLGTYVFSSPMVDPNDPEAGYKQGQFGLKRRQMKTIRRRAKRKLKFYRLLISLGFLPADRKERERMLCQGKSENGSFSPYILRAEALERKLTPGELARVITHLNNHRGFLSPRAQRFISVDPDMVRDLSSDDEETGVMLGQIKRTREIMEAAGFRTPGQLFAAKIKQNELVRLKTKVNRKVGGKRMDEKVRAAKNEALKKEIKNRSYLRPDRFMVRDELRAILELQSKHHPILTPAVQDQIVDIVFMQKDIREDKDRRGFCTFFPDQRRIYRWSMAAQKFDIVQRLSNLEVVPPAGTSRRLTPEELAILTTQLMTGENLKWARAKELLGLSADHHFSREPLDKKQKGTLQELRGNQTAAVIKDSIGEKWDLLNPEAQLELVNDLTANENKRGATSNRYQLLKSKTYGVASVRFTSEEAARLATLELPKGTLSLSHKAIRKILPGMLAGLNYADACARIGLNHAEGNRAGKVSRLTPDLADGILHPGVKCAVINAFRVINAYLDEYPELKEIHVELPREIARSAKQAAEEERRQKDRENENKKIRARLLEAKLAPTGVNFDKAKLWVETGGFLPYDPERGPITLVEACSADYEIDHIVPRGYELIDGFENKVLASVQDNREKGKRTPYEEWGQSPRWPLIVAGLKALKGMSLRKKQRIQSREVPKDFSDRFLTATGYISKEILGALKRLDRDLDITVMPGRSTAFFRRRWGLDTLIPLHPEEEAKLEKRKALIAGGVDPGPMPKFRSNYLHHALDALVVAVTNRSLLQKLSKYYQEEDEARADKIHFPIPDPNLREKVKKALEGAMVVHKPNRKLTGALHKETAVRPVDNIGPGEPATVKQVGTKMVRFDLDGNPSQAYELGSNHHIAIWEGPDGKRMAAVRSLFAVATRKNRGQPAVDTTPPRPGFRFVMSLCGGDTVQLKDGQLAVVGALERDGRVSLWKPIKAHDVGKERNTGTYCISRSTSTQNIAYRIVLDPLGRVLKTEGE
ncbi:MAG: type II CRISPR RNA-guided endonuclease Cas9 [Armatimonadetes bacterium]|nr:type II CRISPR RNA-guided endonuclease Cas9 [Armatimonadota bacterium]